MKKKTKFKKGNINKRKTVNKAKRRKSVKSKSVKSKPGSRHRRSSRERSVGKRKSLRKAGKRSRNKSVKKSIKKSAKGSVKRSAKKKAGSKRPRKRTAKKGSKSSGKISNAKHLLKRYDFVSNDIPVTIKIWAEQGESTHLYEVNISKISDTTRAMLERIRKELINEVTLGIVEITDIRKEAIVENKFKETISWLINKYFPSVEESIRKFLISYLVQKSLGMGNIEVLMNDDNLEEIAINGMQEPVWVYHKEFTWMRTNVIVKEQGIIKHYASMIGRKVGRNISSLAPMLDAHLSTGDRVNATLSPISTKGNTITIRKFARDPWTITKFLKAKTLSVSAAALIWLAMQYELSAIVTGGTASGKTSALNVLASFFPPNQRLISIEDTREISLPKYLHWVPLSTRQPNPEGKGLVSMEHLLANSLRMRPDRVIVGEVRRKFEAETLFEAIHTGHSVYATFHANNAKEVIVRLTNPPIEIPKTMLPSLSLIITQFRNRRTGIRRTLEIAEVLPDSTSRVIMKYDPKKDALVPVARPRQLMQQIKLFSGLSDKVLKKDLADKELVLRYLMKNDIVRVDEVGRVVAEYYSNKQNLLKLVSKNRKI